MSEDDDFSQLKVLELQAKLRSEEKANKVLEILLTDLSFDTGASIDDACNAIDAWSVLMDNVIEENLNHETINSFIALISKHKRAIEMAQLNRDRHSQSIPAINWVRAEWGRKSTEYQSKKEFGQTYAALVLEEFPEIKKIKWRTISEEWLYGL
jgi:hypothetical protein